jgi:predicted Fe-Mo cluster-binding NifX family protein
MKIAFPLFNKDVLAIDFNHSNFIGIYDAINNQTKIINIQSAEKKTETIDAFKLLNSEGLTHVASISFSYLALRIFKEQNIKPLKAKGMSLVENIKLFNETRLLHFEVTESLLYGECAKDCLGCGSDCSDN